MNSITSNVIIVLGWVLTIALTYNLLSGTFDTRNCQSICVNVMYWGALALAVIGVVLAIKQCCKSGPGWLSVVSALAALALLAILVGVMAIGMLTT